MDKAAQITDHMKTLGFSVIMSRGADSKAPGPGMKNLLRSVKIILPMIWWSIFIRLPWTEQGMRNLKLLPIMSMTDSFTIQKKNWMFFVGLLSNWCV